MKEINLLIYGKDAKTNAAARTLKKSPLLNKIYCTRNFNLEQLEVIDIQHKNYKEQSKLFAESGINLILLLDDKAICDGAGEIFKKDDIAVIGVNKTFAQLETSKIFAKKFMEKYGIEHARVLSDKFEKYPQILKFNGFCKGKMCTQIINSKTEKDSAIAGTDRDDSFLEEFIDGDKISITTYTTGGTYTNFGPVKIDSNISYLPATLNANQKLKLNVFLCKLEYALNLEDANFDGFITSNLIWENQNWVVTNFKVNLNDTAAESILTNLKSDLMDILLTGTNPEYKEPQCATIEIYTENANINKTITLPQTSNVEINFEDVRFSGQTILIDGKKIFTISTRSPNPIEVLKNFAQDIKIN